MTDIDELTELTPTHASVLLIDPVELAERSGRSARKARSRGNVLLAGATAAVLVLVVGIGSVFVHPLQPVPGATPSPTPSGFPSARMERQGSSDPAPYTATRATVALVVGGAVPDQLCFGDYTGGQCADGVKLAGVTWAMVPWRTTEGATAYARSQVVGTFDGSTFTATEVTEQFTLAGPPLKPVPARLSASDLIACAVTVNGDSTQGVGYEPMSFPGFEAVWADPDQQRLMVATSGDLGVAVSAVTKASSGPACIGPVPTSGTLPDLLEASKKLKAAKVAGVVSAEINVEPKGVALQVHVVANTPGLSERIAAVVGPSVPVAVDPVMLVLP